MIMIINDCKVDENGVWIPKEELQRLRKHYSDVQVHCERTGADRLGRYYEGKVDILDDVLVMFKSEKKTKLVENNKLIDARK